MPIVARHRSKGGAGTAVEGLSAQIGQAFGEIEVAIPAVTVAELVRGVVRAYTPELRLRREVLHLVHNCASMIP
jgi:predicted nucleic acid-binding protein